MILYLSECSFTNHKDLPLKMNNKEQKMLIVVHSSTVNTPTNKKWKNIKIPT